MKQPSTHIRISPTKRIVKQVMTNQQIWVCSCGYTVAKRNAELSGYDSGSQGFHVHCPKCGRVIAKFVNPKR